MFDVYPVALSPARSRWSCSVYRLLDVYLCILSHCSCQSDIWAWSDVNRWPRLAAGRGRKYQSRKRLILLIVHRIFVLAFRKVSSWTWSWIGRFMSANITRDYESDTCMDKRSIQGKICYVFTWYEIRYVCFRTITAITKEFSFLCWVLPVVLKWQLRSPIAIRTQCRYAYSFHAFFNFSVCLGVE